MRFFLGRTKCPVNIGVSQKYPMMRRTSTDRRCSTAILGPEGPRYTFALIHPYMHVVHSKCRREYIDTKESIQMKMAYI